MRELCMLRGAHLEELPVCRAAEGVRVDLVREEGLAAQQAASVAVPRHDGGPVVRHHDVDLIAQLHTATRMQTPRARKTSAHAL